MFLKSKKDELSEFDLSRKQQETIFTFISDQKQNREKNHYNSLTVLGQFSKDMRDFYIQISTISATIGAFSFLLFGIEALVKTKLLILGDLTLLFTILLSAVFYFVELRYHYYEFYDSYYSTFESQSENISLATAVMSGEISHENFVSSIKLKEREIPEYVRPKKPEFIFTVLTLLSFLVALSLIASSFII